jgi:hypothetical protein
MRTRNDDERALRTLMNHQNLHSLYWSFVKISDESLHLERGMLPRSSVSSPVKNPLIRKNKYTGDVI